MQRTTRTRSLATLALASLSLTAFAACGGDDAESSSVDKITCDAAVAYGAAFAQAPEDPAEFKSFAMDQLVPIADTLVDNLDGDDKQAAETLRETFVEIGNTGDPSVLDTPEAAAATATVGKAIHTGCDLQAVDIEGIEYAFVGTPAELNAGRVSFALTNSGVEDHEMVLFKAADGVTEPLTDLLALPEEEVGSKIEFTGVTFGGPDTTNYVAVDLEPGRYFLVCFLPQGGGEEGPPHFMAGMQATINVA
jgi:hypothetical protein